MKEFEPKPKSTILIDFVELDKPRQREVINLIVEEFYQHDLEKGKTEHTNALNSGKEKALCLFDNNTSELIGAITTKEFEFSKIAPQLFIDARFENNVPADFRLKQFSELLAQNGFQGPYDLAVELAYIVVDKKFRGQGLSNKLFDSQVEKVKQLPGSKIIFGLSRSVYAGTSLSSQLINAMLDVERNINGESDGYVNIQGEWISENKLSQTLGVNLKLTNPTAGSNQSIHQLTKHGAEFIGFSRNLAPVRVLEAK